MRSLINPEIIAKLEEDNLDIVEQALLYLLGTYYKIDTSSIDSQVKNRINSANIVLRDYSKKDGNDYFLIWNIPLFVGETLNIEDRNWNWVEDYRKMFGDLVPTAKGDKAGTIKKMKAYFAAHPDVRKDEVMAAAEYYINDFKNNHDRSQAKFFKQADNFISKQEIVDSKKVTISKLDMYIEIIREQNSKSDQPSNGRHMRGVRR